MNGGGDVRVVDYESPRRGLWGGRKEQVITWVKWFTVFRSDARTRASK
jgi:hypothetical protein